MVETDPFSKQARSLPKEDHIRLVKGPAGAIESFKQQQAGCDSEAQNGKIWGPGSDNVPREAPTTQDASHMVQALEVLTISDS